MCQSIVNKDFRAKKLLLNNIQDEFYIEADYRFLIFAILDEELRFRSRDPIEILFCNNFSLMIDTIKPSIF